MIKIRQECCTDRKWKFSLKSLIYLMTVVFIFLMVSGCTISKDAYIDKLLSDSANQFNSKCPMTIDKDTRLDNSAALPNKTFQYNYTLVNYSKDEIDSDKLQNSLHPNILNQIKTSESMKAFRDNGVTLIYSYKSKDGEFLFSLKFIPDDYR